MLALFWGKRNGAGQEVTEVGLGKTTILQTNRGAVGSVTTAQSMTIEEQIVEEKRHRMRQKP
ncbi:hypothetical protein T11_9353, partial [Trichinella zimbabwensis]